jgi:outer membrane biosynthesis protein TonB
LIFVNVNPAQATAEAPKNAKYYSDKNSRAANPEPDKITEIPKIDGKQTEVVKTETIPHEKFTPLQPSRPAQQPQEPQPEIKPKPAYTPGDLTLAKPSPTPRTTEGDASEAKPPRPRTIREALAQQQDSRLPGEKMKQEGGVQRRHEQFSLDTKATPFGAYDAALVDAISQRWYTLLDEREYASDSRGKVVLQFRLHYDGRITDMNVSESTSSEVLSLICQKAVLDPAPFAAWPSDMRRTLGDTRNIQFTFFYN